MGEGAASPRGPRVPAELAEEKEGLGITGEPDEDEGAESVSRARRLVMEVTGDPGVDVSSKEEGALSSWCAGRVREGEAGAGEFDGPP